MTAHRDGAALTDSAMTPPGLVRLPALDTEIVNTIDTHVALDDIICLGADETVFKSNATECVICGAGMLETTAQDIFQHPFDKPCVAILTNGNGDSIDADYFVASDGNIYAVPPPEELPPVPIDDVVMPTEAASLESGSVPLDDELPEPQLPDVFAGDRKKRKTKKAKGVVLPNNALETSDGDILIPLNADPTIPSMDKGLLAAFAEHKLDRLGGASGDLGWSSFSTFQRCPYLFKRMYIDGQRDKEGRPSPALEIGSAFHTFAAVYYQKIITPDYPLTPELLHEFLIDFGVSMQSLMEAWRIWQGYAIEYETDYVVPLAVEYHIVDPKTKESARFDLIAKVEKPLPGIVAGTYIVEHKSAGRFDDATIDGWRNDGEVLGQIMLWNRLKLNAKFGKLQGVMVNVVGKQKIQKFHRTLVPPQRWQTSQHAKDLQLWQAQRMLSTATGTFPRARANCIGRYGKCSQWTHCADREK
jgi:hypothetical protein